MAESRGAAAEAAQGADKPEVPEGLLKMVQLVTDEVKLDYKFDIDGKTPISVTGKNVVEGIKGFEDPVLDLHKELLENLKKVDYINPTAIQRYGMPQIVAKSDVMACSHTGSGKTATYLLPLLNSLIKAEPRAPPPSPSERTGLVAKGIGSGDSSAPRIHKRFSAPKVLILVPTRELAEQVDEMVKMFSGDLPVRSLAVYGGDSMARELSMLRRGSISVVTATPGRLIHLLTEFDLLKLDKVEFLVIDEADEMFNRGFFPQITQIIEGHMGRMDDRINIMFSATFPRQIQYYAQKFLRRDFAFVVVGIVGGASPDIRQEVIMTSEIEKGSALVDILDSEGDNKILIFCNSIQKVDAVTATLKQRPNLTVSSIHSLQLQGERDRNLADFYAGRIRCLVATSVAARGLNMEEVRCVVNYDFPTDISEYVQRIGRARKLANGLPAVSVSFFDKNKDEDIVDELIFILQDAQQELPVFLLECRQEVDLQRRAFAGEFQYDNANADLVNKMKNLQFKKFIEVEFEDDIWWG